MEMTTPPNPSGFNRKPTRKTNKKYRGKKPAGKNKAELSHSRFSPEMAACIVAVKLLQGAVKLLNTVLDGSPEQANPQLAK